MEQPGTASGTIRMGIGGWTPDTVRELLESTYGGSVDEEIAAMRADLAGRRT